MASPLSSSQTTTTPPSPERPRRNPRHLSPAWKLGRFAGHFAVAPQGYVPERPIGYAAHSLSPKEMELLAALGQPWGAKLVGGHRVALFGHRQSGGAQALELDSSILALDLRPDGIQTFAARLDQKVH